MKILFVEDDSADVELVEIKLIQDDFSFNSFIVDKKDNFLKALDEFSPDIVISDYSMPSFNGLEALKLSKKLKPELPFIILTNSLNEEVAVACLKAGATDYVLKSNLAKLPFSIMESLDQVELKKSKEKAEKDFRDNEEKYRNLVEISPDGIFIIQNSIIVFVNNSGQKLLDANYKVDIIGKNILELFPKLFNSKIGDSLSEIFINPIIGNLVEARMLNFSKKVLDVEISAALFDYNNVASIQLIITDISQRKLTEAHLRQNQKLETLGQIAAGLAHQLNTPLAIISMRLQMLEEDTEIASNSFVLKQLSVAKNNIDKISWLTKKMLGFARKPDNNPQDINVNDLILSIEAFIENLIKNANVSIINDFEKKSIVNIESQMLEQVIINIFTNAIDAMPKGGNINVSTKSIMFNNLNYLSISIKDEGVGMSEDEKQRFFEPFYTTKTSDNGTGLGMFISYNIVKDMGGNIQLESYKGKGTIITVNLPIV